MALTVVISSIKGGVGKTSAAVNLAALAAAGGRRTLLWDLDPQGAATYTLGVGTRVPGGARQLARRKPDAERAVSASAWPGLDLIPADFSLRHLDLELSQNAKPRSGVKRVLAPLADRYDTILVDCPPGITLAIESALRSSDVLLVPIVPAVLPLRSFDQLVAYVAADTRLRGVDVLGFLSMVDRRKNSHRNLARSAEREQILDTTIPASVHVENMASVRAPLVSSAPRSPAAIAYRNLWDELLERHR